MWGDTDSHCDLSSHPLCKTNRHSFSSHWSSSQFQSLFKLCLSACPLVPVYWRTLHYTSPISELPGQNCSGFPILPFGLGASSVSPPNFSFLPHVEVGYLLWKSMQTFTFIRSIILFLAILASESCSALSKLHNSNFYLNIISFISSPI
jgi:hypothetical protein